MGACNAPPFKETILKLKTYDVLINRGRDVALCEISKAGISEYELRVLRTIHTGEGITAVKHVGEQDFNEGGEINRLASIYGQQLIEKLFSTQLDNFENWLAGKTSNEHAPGESAVYPSPRDTAVVQESDSAPHTLTMANIKKPIENRVE